jgi:hypothetical protein
VSGRAWGRLAGSAACGVVLAALAALVVGFLSSGYAWQEPAVMIPLLALPVAAGLVVGLVRAWRTLPEPETAGTGGGRPRSGWERLAGAPGVVVAMVMPVALFPVLLRLLRPLGGSQSWTVLGTVRHEHELLYRCGVGLALVLACWWMARAAGLRGSGRGFTWTLRLASLALGLVVAAAR